MADPSGSVRLDITNTRTGDLFTGPLDIGDRGTVVHLLLDSGSSTLAVLHDALADGDVASTTLAQEISYGMGDLKGPVVSTTVGFGAGPNRTRVPDVKMMLVSSVHARRAGPAFGAADGILGLAYAGLNAARDLGHDTLAGFSEGAYQAGTPQPVEPYFRQMEEAGVVADTFAIAVHRSCTHRGGPSPEADPLNRGTFVVGGGEEHTDLYDGAFQDAAVIHDLYYNVRVSGVGLGDGGSVDGDGLIEVDGVVEDDGSGSNAIVDTGAPILGLPTPLYRELRQRMEAHVDMAASPGSEAELEGWPTLTLVLQGDREDVVLRLPPEAYWQLRAEEDGSARMVLRETQAPMLVLGLPLMTRYFTVFDRSADGGRGRIRFAPLRSVVR